MEISKAALQRALEKVRPGLATKEVCDQATHFAFMGDRVVTYNDEISISCALPDIDLTGAVSAQELYSFLNKIAKDAIQVEQKDAEMLFSSGRFKAGLTFQQEIKLPLHELGQYGKWKSVPENLLTALAFCKFSCARDLSMPVLNCMHVHKDGFVESCDNMRYTKHNFSGGLPVDTFLVPVSSASELLNYGVSKMSTSQGWVHFQTEDKSVIFSCRVFDVDYPNTEGITDLGKKPTAIEFPKTIGDVLGRADVFAKSDEGNPTIQVELQNNRLKISSRNDAGWFEEETNMKYKGSPFAFFINPTFLGQVLRLEHQCELGQGKLIFKGDSWEHLVPIRTDG